MTATAELRDITVAVVREKEQPFTIEPARIARRRMTKCWCA